MHVVDATLEEMRSTGQIRPGLNPLAIRSALIGLTEGALRDQLLAERAGQASEFTTDQIGALADALIESITV